MRSNTQEIYQNIVNQIIDHIHANLHKPLQLDVIADRVHVSQRQLLRIARSFLNESLSAYVARQRMERAVMYLQTEEHSLTALAEKVGYDNPQSFSKAFKKQFGISPMAYMNKRNAQLENQVNNCDKKDYPQAGICEEEDINLVYIRIIGKYGEDKPYETAWGKLVGFLQSNGLLTGNVRFIGVSFDDPHVTKPNLCRFYACAAVQEKIVPTGEFGTIRLPRGKYAVYTLKGSYAGLQALYDHISLHLGYPLRYGMAFEEYLNSPEDTPETELLTKVFIPVQ